MKNIDRQPRKVTEIRVYYDDQTYETFVPAKSKWWVIIYQFKSIEYVIQVVA